MDAFPSEFADLLNARGKRMLANPPRLDARGKTTPIVVLDDVIDRGVAAECVRLLDRTVYPRLKRMHTPIPREALTGMKWNYSERLPKTVRVKTATFNSRRSAMLLAAQENGLARMMSSPSFFAFAEAVAGGALCREHHGRQVICYEAGDYSGPHNDHHPERDAARNGFIDLHIMFSNEAVASQHLVYENREHYLSEAHDVSGPAGIAVYRLPFWHYTTPLIPRRGRERDARRWLLLGSFDYVNPPRKLEY
ncbi:MAG TPA: hypothetical protein VFN10_15405 [Thermoanaerobaculia bacterium]|nr:hypothetical protein [Thermoanaerobaculia bacterium]